MRRPWLVHAALLLAVAVIGFPLYYAAVISTQSLPEVLSRPPKLWPSTYAAENYLTAWEKAGMGRLLLNSAVVALGVAAGKIAIALLSAFALVYFRVRGARLLFGLVLLTLMLPLPVRIISTYEVVSALGWINTYAGLIVPLVASATATIVFRQFYLTVPDELAEAAQVDGAGPLRFFAQILLPLSVPSMAALFVVLFIYGWNEYLWPLMITNTQEMRVVVIGLEALTPRYGTELPTYNVLMAGALMALLPPLVVILALQRWFIGAIMGGEK
jgi:sn-glycerol 3-phosphate transport system permease protein